jgi:hypothetical protein
MTTEDGKLVKYKLYLCRGTSKLYCGSFGTLAEAESAITPYQDPNAQFKIFSVTTEEVLVVQ